MYIVLGLLLLVSLVILHELGHFWAARRAGIEVEEFGIGFPPRAKVLTKKNGTEYTLNWLPLGGFVKLKGEHDADETPGSFGAARLPQKVLVMVAGVGMNVLAAMALLTIVALSGMPQVIDNQFSVASDSKVVQHDVVASVQEDSQAAKAGLENGDKLRRIYTDGQSVSINEAKVLQDTTKSFAGQTVNIDFERDGEQKTASATLLSVEEVEASKATESPKGHLGIVPSDYVKTRATWSAPIVGVVTTGQFFLETLKGLGNIVADLFRGNASTAADQVTGIVGIGYVLGEISSEGFMQIILLTALISVSLAVMNVLPIPALDGGRLFVTLLFRGLRRPLTKETEERIHGTGFALLMVLFVLITILDVQRFII